MWCGVNNMPIPLKKKFIVRPVSAVRPSLKTEHVKRRDKHHYELPLHRQKEYNFLK